MTTVQKTTVITTQVQRSGGKTTVNTGDKEWSTEICGMCDDMKICACVAFCTPCYACYLSKRLGEHCCVPVVAGVLPLRVKTRLMLGIRGTICNDFCCLYCLQPCTLCQLAREMKHAGWLE